jgi:hypothetical protein
MSPIVTFVVIGPIDDERPLRPEGTTVVGEDPGDGRPRRDVYADFLRALSLLVVIMWHWAFTILVWSDTGPYATNPIGFTSGLWIMTWLL